MGIFSDENIGDQRFGGQIPWHYMLGRSSLEHAIAARSTRHFGRGVTMTRYWTGMISSQFDITTSNSLVLS
jgi:hypothetical protein